MKAQFIGQPFREWPANRTFLNRSLADPEITHLRIVTAWVRESGLKYLEGTLNDFANRGGHAEMIVGIDLKGTSVQGLELAMKLVDQIHVVHDQSGRTFHPKLYLASGTRRAHALIGSSNLTAGGLDFNYEGGVTLSFDPRREPNVANQINGFAEKLIADKPICRRLTSGVLRRLEEENWLADEKKDRLHRAQDRIRNTRVKGGSPLFSQSGVDKRKGAALPVQTSDGVAQRGPKKRSPDMLVRDSWSKRLLRGDAQRPMRGHPTGAVRLTPPIEAVEKHSYFRNQFFGEELWKRGRDSNGNTVFLLTISAETIVGGKNLGTRDFVIDYAPHRNRRGRATTIMRWGSTMVEIRSTDVTSWYLVIDRAAVGAYRVTIQPREPV